MLEIPDCYVKEINKLSLDFIWEGKPAKIKRKTIISDISQGGLRMMDFEIKILDQENHRKSSTSMENNTRVHRCQIWRFILSNQMSIGYQAFQP